MATYTIVDPSTTPLGPNEIHSNDTILVSEGDVYIIDPSATGKTTFEPASGLPTNFEVQVNDSSTNSFEIDFGSELSPVINVGDDVTAPDLTITADATDDLVMNVGNNVTLGGLIGPSNGPSNVTIGDGFSTAQNWGLDGTGTTLTVGDNATFEDIKASNSDDVLLFGDGATVQNIDTRGGNVSITFGDDATINKTGAGSGDDNISYGNRAQVGETDGGSDNDTYSTQTGGTYNNKNIESQNVVCFVAGTRIETRKGDIAVERLEVGDLVRTVDHGFQPLRWIGSTHVEGETLGREDRLRPIRIVANGLGQGRPVRDLFVSPQHRILIDSPISKRMFGSEQVLVVAKKLLAHPGVKSVNPYDGVEYFHLLFDRHEVVFSENLASESLLLALQATKTIGASAVDGILRASPLARDIMPARPVLKEGLRIEKLVQRHLANKKPMQNSRKKPPVLSLVKNACA